MHDRDFIWTTSKGKKIKIKDMSSSHLENTLNKITKESYKFESILGKDKFKKTSKNIKQEIRLRKLNRLSNKEKNGTGENLF